MFNKKIDYIDMDKYMEEVEFKNTIGFYTKVSIGNKKYMLENNNI